PTASWRLDISQGEGDEEGGGAVGEADEQGELQHHAVEDAEELGFDAGRKLIADLAEIDAALRALVAAKARQGHGLDLFDQHLVQARAKEAGALAFAHQARSRVL